MSTIYFLRKPEVLKVVVEIKPGLLRPQLNTIPKKRVIQGLSKQKNEESKQ
jgi:hypothetical protein